MYKANQNEQARWEVLDDDNEVEISYEGMTEAEAEDIAHRLNLHDVLMEHIEAARETMWGRFGPVDSLDDDVLCYAMRDAGRDRTVAFDHEPKSDKVWVFVDGECGRFYVFDTEQLLELHVTDVWDPQGPDDPDDIGWVYEVPARTTVSVRDFNHAEVLHELLDHIPGVVSHDLRDLAEKWQK